MLEYSKSIVKRWLCALILQSVESYFPLPNQLVDGIITSLVIHEVDDPVVFFCELNRILKTDGRLVVIEWAKASMEMGPPIEHRLAIQQLDDWALTTGLVKGKSWQWSDNFIGVEYSRINKPVDKCQVHPKCKGPNQKD